MVEIEATRKADAEKKLRQAMEWGLAAAGVDAEVRISAVPGTRMHRVALVGPGLTSLGPSERHYLVTNILREQLTPEERVRVSLLYTLAPDEVPEEEGWWSASPDPVAA